MTFRAENFEGFAPYRPPWYPHDDDPWAYVNTMSDAQVTNYSRWRDSLPPGELHRLIAEHQRPACECGAKAGEVCPGEPFPCSRSAP